MAAINPPTSVLRMPPHGEPNLRERFVAFSNDPRTRVIKPKQTGITCFINALYWIIPRIGEHPDCQGLKGRNLEVLTEKLRQDLVGNPGYAASCGSYEQFLKSLGIDFVEEYEKIPSVYFWHQLPDFKQYAFLQTLTHKHLIELNQLSKSAWNPHQSIQSLIKELKSKGPLFVSGRFGSCYYKADPSPKPSVAIEGIIPFGWSSDQAMPLQRNLRVNECHCILLCGAQVTADGKEFVYYKDPNFDSVPLHLRQPDTTYYDLFVMRYDKLKKEVITSFNIYSFQHWIDQSYAIYSKELAHGSS